MNGCMYGDAGYQASKTRGKEDTRAVLIVFGSYSRTETEALGSPLHRGTVVTH